MGKKPPTTFESLSTELLEEIFFYSLNVNLPRASPYLAAALSNERVYRLLILLGYWDNDHEYDKEYNSAKGKDVFGGDPARYGDPGMYTWRENRSFNIPWILKPFGHGYTPLTSRERGILQSSILQCKWCTNDRIRKQLPDLTRLIIARWCISAGYIFDGKDKGQKLDELIQSEKEGKVYQFYLSKTNKEHPGQEEEEEEEEEEKDGFLNCQVTFKPGEFVAFKFSSYEYELFCLNASEPDMKQLWCPLLSIREIPPSLFRADINSNHKGLVQGYFTKAHISLLNTIRVSGQLIFHMSSETYPRKIAHSRDALQQGIHIALSTLNVRALDALLKIDHYLYRNDGPCYTMPSGHFRTAAQVYITMDDIYMYMNTINSMNRVPVGVLNEDLDIRHIALLSFGLLLISSAESIPYDDPVVKEFAELVGGAFGKWLLDCMMELPYHAGRVQNEYGAFFIARRPNAFTIPLLTRYYHQVMPSYGVLRMAQNWADDELTETWRRGEEI